MEAPDYPFSEALNEAGKFEIDLTLSALAGLVQGRETIPATDILDVMDGLLDRRNEFDEEV
jgi:hypothetical protein